MVGKKIYMLVAGLYFVWLFIYLFIIYLFVCLCLLKVIE